MSTIKVQDIQHTGNSNDAISLASDSSVALKHSGSSKLTTSSTGVSVTGTCTATTFSGSGASLTALPAANLTGTLPALSAANLTSIPAANLTGTLPAIDGSNLTGISTDLVGDTSPQLGGDLDLQSNQITTSTSDGNIKATPNGDGVFEVRSSGSVDGTMQLNCTVNSHGIKLRSPAHSAGQSYTFIFPDNNITADKYLKVKSVSGTPATEAVGQLEYASLDANDLGEGTIPDARFPATLPAASAANLTAIPAANITGTLPAINGAALTDLDGSNIATGTVAAARVATLNQDTTGSAATLTTARAINGVNFDGSADITVADSTKMPLAGGTFTGTIIVEDAINENVFAITDASSVALDPDNGMVQTWTLGANRTATDSLTTGQSMLLIVTASSSNYTLTWPTIKWNGGAAPTLGGANATAIELFKVGSQLYGATVGDLS